MLEGLHHLKEGCRVITTPGGAVSWLCPIDNLHTHPVFLLLLNYNYGQPLICSSIFKMTQLRVLHAHSRWHFIIIKYVLFNLDDIRHKNISIVSKAHIIRNNTQKQYFFSIVSPPCCYYTGTTRSSVGILKHSESLYVSYSKAAERGSEER